MTRLLAIIMLIIFKADSNLTYQKLTVSIYTYFKSHITLVLPSKSPTI